MSDKSLDELKALVKDIKEFEEKNGVKIRSNFWDNSHCPNCPREIKCLQQFHVDVALQDARFIDNVTEYEAYVRKLLKMEVSR